MRRLLLVFLLACHGKSKEAPPTPATIEVRDGSGALTVELRPLKPCRGTIGPMELIVGGPPLISQIGDTRWSGETGSNGTTLLRDGDSLARISPVGDPQTVAILDTHGIAVLRVAVQGNTAVVSDASTVPVRTLTKKDKSIAVDQPVQTITGTNDLVLAALLASPELLPEIRILAACERVLVKK